MSEATDRSSFWRASVLLICAPVLVHLPELAGWISCAPLPDMAGLSALPARHLLSGSCFVDGNTGATLLSLGHRSAEDWLSFHLPWWNPYSGLGMPLAAEIQPASFFLPFVLLLHFAGGILLLKLTMQVLAGLFMYGCAREFRMTFVAALGAALLFEFNGTFAWFSDTPMLPIAFLPLLVMGVERCRNRARVQRRGGIALVACAVAYSILAGFPETVFVDGLAGLFWALLAMPGLAPAMRLRFAAKVVAGGTIGLLLAAPALMVFGDYLRHANLGLRLGADDVLRHGQAATLILPTLYGPPYRDWDVSAWPAAGGYLGSAALLVGLCGFFSARIPPRLSILAAIWSGFWLAVCVGEPVSRAIWHTTPGLNQVIVTRYAMPSVEFLWTMLIGVSVDAWRRQELKVWPAAILTAGFDAAAIVLGLLSGRLGLPPDWSTLCYAVLTMLWAVFVLCSLLMLLRRQATRMARCMTIGVLLADAVLAFAVPIATGSVASTGEPGLIAFLKSQPGYGRVYGFGLKLAPNYGAFFGIPTLKSLMVPTPALWLDFSTRLGGALEGVVFPKFDESGLAAHLAQYRARFEDVGLSLILVDAHHDWIEPLHDPHFVPVFASASSRVYRLPGAAPYFEASGETARSLHSVASRSQRSATSRQSCCAGSCSTRAGKRALTAQRWRFRRPRIFSRPWLCPRAKAM